MIAIIFLFILYYIIAPFVVFTFLRKLYPQSDNNSFYILISLIIGPVFYTLINYYCLLIPFSNNNFAFYLFIIVISLLISASILWTNKQSFIDIIKFYSRELTCLYTILIILIPIFIIKPISGHDFIEYCLFGKMLAENGTINWSNYWYNSETGFYYVGLHGFSFPLFGSIEVWLTNILEIKSNFLLLKSIPIYYAIMIIANGYVLFSYFKKELFWHFVIVLFSSFYFFTFATNFHIDTIRTSLLMLSITLLYLIFENKIKFDIYLLAVICGLAAFTHSLNAIVLSVTSILPIFYLKEKKGRILNYFFILILAGYIHYLIDIFIGGGWIFKEIKFY